MKKALAVLLIALTMTALFAQGAVEAPAEEPVVEATYTLNDYTTVSPSNWNELTYQDENDRQIMSYIASPFFEFDFKFDESGEIIDGEFEIKMSAITAVEDITSTLVGNEEYGITEGEKGRAYKFTLRDDLTWDDGTKIAAKDFVYSMKEQLNPLFKNYRADSYYVGAEIIHNAQNYFLQGQTAMIENATGAYYGLSDLVLGEDGIYRTPEGGMVYLAVNYPLSDWLGGDTLAAYVGAYGAAYFDTTNWEQVAALANEEGLAPLTEESYKLYATVTTGNPAWGETEADLPAYFVYEQTFPEMDFSEVGLFVGDNELELVVILDKALNIFDEDGSLNYHAPYEFSGFPLVKEDLYEACKIAPVEGSTLWTSNYCSSVETTASWGPYKLTEFQAGKTYTLSKNEEWYGFKANLYEGQYQTTSIVCETIAEFNTAWLKFLAGEINAMGLDVSVAADYKGSERAYFTPGDFVSSMQLQSSYDALKARQKEGINKTILSYTDFRKAISVGINRADYTAKCTTAYLPGFGLFTDTLHYYDVANGGLYRKTDPARKALCNAYGVDASKYASLEEAEESITGYNIELAKQLMESAYQQALADGEISATDKVVLTVGTSADNESTRRTFEFLNNAMKEIAVGTSLEGRFELEFDASFGTKWADDFRDGAYDICTGGWTGADWNPGYMLLAYLSPDYMYSAAWDTSSEMMEYTMVTPEGEITDTLSLMDWYDCLNGNGGCKYNWSSAYLAEEYRLPLMAALEEQILTHYYTVPLAYQYSASIMGYKTDYITYTYNTFMSYGGIQYMYYNYSDAEWAEFVASQKGEINYK